LLGSPDRLGDVVEKLDEPSPSTRPDNEQSRI
jgi:hypothetical protein